MIGNLDTEWDPDHRIWIDFATIGCDFCPTTYPESEYPVALIDAEDEGWQVEGNTGLVCCPDCHRRGFRVPP